LKKDAVPAEFSHLFDREKIPWDRILVDTEKRMKKGMNDFEAFTDATIVIAKRECKKKKPNPNVLVLALEACLDRGKFKEVLTISSCSDHPEVLGLRAIALSTISDYDGIQETLDKLETAIDEESASVEDKLRLLSSRIFLGAAKRDEAVIAPIIELDSILDSNPEQAENPLPEVTYALYVTGVLFSTVGELERALNVAMFLETVAHANDRRPVLILSENLRGRLASMQGQFREAIIHFKRIEKVSREIASEVGLGVSLNNLGSLALNAIQLEKAFDYLKEATQYLQMDAHRIHVLTNMGEILTLLHKYEESKEIMLEAIKLNHETGVEIIEPYTWMVILLSRSGDLDNVRDYLKKAKEITKITKSPKDTASYYHAKGVLEATEKKTSTSIKSLTKAMEISKENNLIEWLIRSKLAIVRTYLGAFNRSGKEEHLANSTYHLDDLIQISKEQELHSLRAEVLLLRSEIRMHGGNRKEAEDDLERVAGLAVFLDNMRLEKVAKDRMRALMETPSDSTIIEEADIDRSMDRVEGFHPAGEPKDVPAPKIHVLIALNRQSGLPEFVHHFDDSLEMDSSLLSGFVSAITSFSGEMMGSGMIRSINQEGFTLMMEHTPSRIVTLVASEETFDVRYKLHQFAQLFSETFPASYDSVVTSEYSAASELVLDIFSSLTTTA
jgi:tetratricopeptide (TPR) repeat protein